MVLMRQWVLLWAFLLAGGLRLLAASEEETRYQAALRDFRSNLFDRAEHECGEFVQTHTNSPHLPEVLLLQAEARLSLGQPAGALELLTAHLPQAGKWTDAYLYYLGEAYARSGDYRKARDTFGDLLQHFPASTNGLKAVVGQAVACSKLEDWPRVLELLQQTDGVFQAAVRTNSADAFAQRGLLLLGEAWLRQPAEAQKFTAAEAALQPLAHVALTPEIDWQRQELLCRILLGSGRTNQALQNTTNLLVAATQSGRREWQAHSYEFRASLLEGLGRLDEAITAYTNNLVEGVPDDLRRWALLQSTKLFLAQQKTTNAIQTLERFLGQYSNAPAADVALLTLGELHLGEFISSRKTNALEAASVNVPTNATARLQEVVARFPQSPFAPKAQLDLGWCYWMGGDLTNAQTSFQTAAQHLATASEQAVAFFKLADTQARLGQFGAALSNYAVVIEKSAALPEVRAALEEPALYQMVYVGLKAGEFTAATNALGTLLAQFPDGFRTTPAVLLAGQALGEGGHADRARAILEDFVARNTNAPAEVQLALARTWEEEGNWTNAIREYRGLLNHCTNAPTRAEAEFGCAQATWRAGDPTNALSLYTNFIAQFSTHPKAPVAQLWVGDYYFNLGNPSAAEFNYQKLCEEPAWRGSELVYRARMMAGRAAFQQNLWKNAVNDFTNLTMNLVNCPSNILVEAMFAFGDCELSQLTKDHGDTNNLGHLKQAKFLFNNIAEKYPGTPQMFLAWGRKADTLVQLAQYTGDNQECTNALNTYQQIITNTAADVTVRSMAEVGSAVAWQMLADQKSGAEQAALLRLALDHCVNVANAGLLGPDEKGDPNWTLKAGDMAIDLAAALQDWPAAIGLCERLGKRFDVLSARYAERANTFRARQSSLTRN